MHRISLLLLALCASAPFGSAEPTKEPTPKIDPEFLLPDPDIEWLKRSKVATDTPGLLAYLRSCQGKDIAPADIIALVAKLTTGTKDEQDAANARLLELGTIAVPELRKHRTATDAAGGKRVRECLAKLEETGDRPLARPAMRKLLNRRPPGTVEALLGFLPFASDPAAEEDVYYGLDGLVERDPKLLTLLDGFLKDNQPARRALAACILGRRGNPQQRESARVLLKDPDPLVRLRTAQGLLGGHDACGVASLIELITDPAIEIAWQAEELLRWTADESAPELIVSARPAEPEASAKAAKDAWLKWAKDHANKINFAELEKQPRRPLLLMGYNRDQGKLWIFGSDGVTRHEWPKMAKLADAQYVPGGTVLTLHEQPVREKPLLAERVLSGEMLWNYANMADPRYVQRLSNGQVFVAEYQDIAEPFLRYLIFAPDGTLEATQPQKCAMNAHAIRMTPDGMIACVRHSTNNDGSLSFNQLHEYRPSTEEIRELKFDSHNYTVKFNLEPTIERGYLLSALDSAYNSGAPVGIVEIDPFSDTSWRYLLERASHAVQLRCGTTVACAPGRVVEVMKDHRQVGEIPFAEAPEIAQPICGIVRFGFDRFPADTDLKSAIEYRVQALKRKKSHERVAALRALQAFGPAAAIALPAMKRLDTDPDPQVQTALRHTRLVIDVKELERLLAGVKDPDLDVRVQSMAKLRNYVSPEVLEVLLVGLKDENRKIRSFAAGAFQSGYYPFRKSANRWAWAAEKIVPALIKTVVTDKDNDIRISAIRSLSGFGESASAAVPLLVSIIQDDKEPWNTRRWTINALSRIDNSSREVVAAYYVALKSPVAVLRGTAAGGLATVKPVSAETLRQLRDAYWNQEDQDPPRERVGGLDGVGLLALRALNANDKDTLEHYMKILNDEMQSFTSRWNVAKSLFKIGNFGPALDFAKKHQFAADKPEDRNVARMLFLEFQRELTRARWNAE